MEKKDIEKLKEQYAEGWDLSAIFGLVDFPDFLELLANNIKNNLDVIFDDITEKYTLDSKPQEVEVIKSVEEVIPLSDNIVVYTDGACFPNPGKGSYAVIILEDGKKFEYSGRFEKATNNRMELFAVIEALRKLKDKRKRNITIYSDSEYVIKAINNKWVNKWATFDNFKGKKNKDLWLTYLEAVIDFKNVKFVWVKGHNGNKYNERADQLAGEALKRK